MKLSEKIYNELNEKGANLGNISISIIDKIIEKECIHKLEDVLTEVRLGKSSEKDINLITTWIMNQFKQEIYY